MDNLQGCTSSLEKPTGSGHVYGPIATPLAIDDMLDDIQDQFSDITLQNINSRDENHLDQFSFKVVQKGTSCLGIEFYTEGVRVDSPANGSAFPHSPNLSLNSPGSSTALPDGGAITGQTASYSLPQAGSNYIPVSPNSPNYNQSFSPDSPSYSPNSPSYSPNSPSYSPSSPRYSFSSSEDTLGASPTQISPEYVPTVPQSHPYWEIKKVIAQNSPKRLILPPTPSLTTPHNDHASPNCSPHPLFGDLNSPTYSPSPMYNPSPRYLPSPKYSPNSPHYEPTSPVYEPTSPYYEPTRITQTTITPSTSFSCGRSTRKGALNLRNLKRHFKPKRCGRKKIRV